MRMLMVVFALILSSCGALRLARNPTPEEEETLIWEAGLSQEKWDYMDRIRLIPREFPVAKDKAEEAWARGITFITKYSGMKIQNASEYSVSTFNSIITGASLKDCASAYTITRVPQGEKFMFSVSCQSANVGYLPCYLGQMRNEKILAHYILTGELPFPDMIQ